jgi:hypothetical protein
MTISDDESAQAKPERAFTEVLQELRVVQTGVQILSAFLLTLPFTVRFGQLTAAEKSIYVVSVVAASVSMALVIAPVSCRHRVGRDTPALVRVSSRLAQAGMLALLIAVVFSVLLALDIAVGLAWASGLTCVVALAYLGLWYMLPTQLGLGSSRRHPDA